MPPKLSAKAKLELTVQENNNQIAARYHQTDEQTVRRCRQKMNASKVIDQKKRVRRGKKAMGSAQSTMAKNITQKIKITKCDELITECYEDHTRAAHKGNVVITEKCYVAEDCTSTSSKTPR
jgi:hypothetical protein